MFVKCIIVLYIVRRYFRIRMLAFFKFWEREEREIKENMKN